MTTQATMKLTILKQLTSGHTDRDEERQILAILGEADADQLNELLLGVDLKRLLSSVDDRLLGPDNRTALLELLCERRVHDLGLDTRAALVTAMQVGRTGAQEERAVRDLFLATHGEDLTTLKNYIDAGKDWRDLQELIFHDVDDEGIQNKILEHIGSQAPPRETIKVLSDIDDTIYASLNDCRYPRRTVYPGVFQFYKELTRRPVGRRDHGTDRVFLQLLTARPGTGTGVVEDFIHRSLEKLGIREAVVLTGDLPDLVSHQAMANKKVENFLQFAELYPEYAFVFIGDSGQGDVEAGVDMLEKRPEPDALRAVFIHDVMAASGEKRVPHEDVHFFDTYVGAAAKAFELGLIPAEGLREVIGAARLDFRNLDFDDDQQRAKRQAELDRDVARAEQLL